MSKSNNIHAYILVCWSLLTITTACMYLILKFTTRFDPKIKYWLLLLRSILINQYVYALNDFNSVVLNF